MTFMLWLALPKGFREPKTRGELAQELGVAHSLLSRWQSLPGFADAVYERAQTVVKVGWLADILEAQAEKAIRGDTNAARFVFEAVGVMRGSVSLTQVNNNCNMPESLEWVARRLGLSQGQDDPQDALPDPVPEDPSTLPGGDAEPDVYEPEGTNLKPPYADLLYGKETKE